MGNSSLAPEWSLGLVTKVFRSSIQSARSSLFVPIAHQGFHFGHRGVPIVSFNVILSAYYDNRWHCNLKLRPGVLQTALHCCTLQVTSGWRGASTSNILKPALARARPLVGVMVGWRHRPGELSHHHQGAGILV